MKIFRAGRDNVDQLAVLFDLYRQFYEQDADLEACRRFIGDRIGNKESVVLVAESQEGRLLGFTQVYHSFCSVAMDRIIYLYDLYVHPDARGTGLGRALMNAATDYARSQGASRLQLETAHSNIIGQNLYESLGYEKDEEFYTYHLELGHG